MRAQYGLRCRTRRCCPAGRRLHRRFATRRRVYGPGQTVEQAAADWTHAGHSDAYLWERDRILAATALLATPVTTGRPPPTFAKPRLLRRRRWSVPVDPAWSADRRSGAAQPGRRRLSARRARAGRSRPATGPPPPYSGIHRAICPARASPARCGHRLRPATDRSTATAHRNRPATDRRSRGRSSH